MTLKELQNSGNIIFECIAGSRTYGLATHTSDTDIRGVFILPKEQFYSLNYIGQINNDSNDIVYYELRKFIELCSKNNPNILEMLNIPDDCILYKHKLFEDIKKELFLSKLCKKTFANYAFSQIKKARGLNKKIVNPVEKERKSVLDFCYVYHFRKSVPLNAFLKMHKIDQKNCGISNVSNMKNVYNIFHSLEIPYKGIVKGVKANEIALSSIPMGENAMGVFYFNKEGYSTYCKKYKEYWSWVKKRNNERYKSNVSYDKNYDAKNMMHTFRLLLMAKEIGEEGTINVRRKDRNYLLSIKNAAFEYDDLVNKAEALKNQLDTIFMNSNLKEAPNLIDVNSLLITIRDKFYNQNL